MALCSGLFGRGFSFVAMFRSLCFHFGLVIVKKVKYLHLISFIWALVVFDLIWMVIYILKYVIVFWNYYFCCRSVGNAIFM